MATTTTTKPTSNSLLPAESKLVPSASTGLVKFDSRGRIESFDMEGLWRLATLYARSDMVPAHFRGKPDNCAIAIQLAIRCGVDVFVCLQNMYVVHGRPGIEAKLAIAMLNASGLIRGRVRYRMAGEGKTRSCTAIVTDHDGEEVEGPAVTWGMVEAEGWQKDKGSQTSKWKTLPDLMFRYRAALFLIRTTYPEVLMGMQTVDELEEQSPEDWDRPASRHVMRNLDDLAARLSPPVDETDELPGVTDEENDSEPDDEPADASEVEPKPSAKAESFALES